MNSNEIHSTEPDSKSSWDNNEDRSSILLGYGHSLIRYNLTVTKDSSESAFVFMVQER